MSDHPPAESRKERLMRTPSFNILDVRTNFWNPFSKHSAVLLDLTEQGFKIEFIEAVIIEPQAHVSLHIPLSPFRIPERTTLKLKAVVKWFERASMRAGGEFLALQPAHIETLKRMIAFLRKQEGWSSTEQKISQPAR